MTILYLYCKSISFKIIETISISIVASIIFATIIYLIGLLYDFCKYSRHLTTYNRVYKGTNESLKGEIAATAKVTYGYKNELNLIVTTFINEDNNENHSKHNKFDREQIQKWQGRITMENSEAGKLYFYYTEPTHLKNNNIANFKRVLFLHQSKFLILFGEGKWNGMNEEFKRK